MKIQIIGGSGAGKSTLAEYIAEKEQIKWIDTDTYLWKDDSFTENNPIEKRREMYRQDMETAGNYVVSGSVYAWCPEGFRDRDLLVFLSLNESERLERLRKREIQRKTGKKSWLDDTGAFTNEFIEWCKTYLTASDKSMIGTFAAQSHELELSASPILKLDSARPIEELYENIIEYFAEIKKNNQAAEK